jgi:hypothetical protein
MALLRRRNSNPIDGAQAELAELQHRRETLQNRLAEARGAVDAAHARRREALLAGDLSDPAIIAGFDRACRDADDAVTGLKDASVALDAQITAVEFRLTTERDRATRQAEAKLRGEQITEARDALDRYVTATDQLVIALRPLIATVLAADAIVARFDAVAHDLAVGTPRGASGSLLQVIGSAESYIARVVAGAASIAPNPAPPVPPPPVPPPDVPRRTVYLLEPSRWCENGEVHTRGEGHLVALPLALADAAQRLGHVLALGDPAIERLRPTHPVGYQRPDPGSCVDIEKPRVPKPPLTVKPPGALHSMFDAIVAARAGGR